MTEKIEFYRELLHIDPSSKVFYPLAALFFEARRLEDTVKVLRQGLAVYGDHLEARLLLVEALDHLGRQEEAAAESEVAIRILSRFPAFWRIWTAKEATGSQDLALALNFLANHFKGQSVSWAELIRSAFDFLAQNKGSSLGEELLPLMEGIPESGLVEPAPASADFLSGQPRQAKSRHSSIPARASADLPPQTGTAPLNKVRSVPAAKGAEEPRKATERKVGSSLRTRTMADLLASQGDFEGAADIYEELMQESGDERQRQALIEALGKVRAESAQKKGQPFFGSKPLEGQTHQAQASDEQNLEEDRLIGMLEKLARRLESRSNT